MGVITRRGGGIDIMCNVQTNVSRGDVSQSPSPITPGIALNFSDEEEIGDWIWKNSLTARLIGAKNSEELS